MPRRIDGDHKDFQDVYGGLRRKELKKFIKNGSIFRRRGKDGKVVITIPKTDKPTGTLSQQLPKRRGVSI